MADDDQRAGPAVEQVLERGQRVDVEVVGGLVEQQDVRLAHQQAHELQPAALAAGEVLHQRAAAARRGSRSARTAIRRSARGRRRGGRSPRTSSTASSTRRWPGISAVSWERKRELDRRAARRPRRSRAPARRRARFVSDVLPEPLTPTSAKRSPGPSRQVTSRRAACRRRRARRARRRCTLLPRRDGGEAQQLGPVARLGLVGDQRVGGLDPELRLGGARRRAAAQPRELLAQQLLAALFARRGLARALGAGEHVGRVAALVLVDRGVGDLPGERADGVQEPAIVGDDEHRAAARGEVVREPVDALDVEVVGRLVEQQQLGVAEQRLGERDPAPLAAGQRRDRGVEALREAARSRRRRAGRRARSRKRASAAHSWSARPPTSSSRIVRSRVAGRRPGRASRRAGRRRA